MSKRSSVNSAELWDVRKISAACTHSVFPVDKTQMIHTHTHTDKRLSDMYKNKGDRGKRRNIEKKNAEYSSIEHKQQIENLSASHSGKYAHTMYVHMHTWGEQTRRKIERDTQSISIVV